MRLTYLRSSSILHYSTKYLFLQALDIVRSRSLFLCKGFAFVKVSQLITIVTARFRMNLSKSLTQAFQALGQVDGRNTTHVGENYSKDSSNLLDKLTPANVDAMAEQRMPCV